MSRRPDEIMGYKWYLELRRASCQSRGNVREVILFILRSSISVHRNRVKRTNYISTPVRVCIFVRSLSTILTGKINLYSHTVYANYVTVCALGESYSKNLRANAFIILSSFMKRELILCNNFSFIFQISSNALQGVS